MNLNKLIQKAQQGDKAAFTDIYQSFLPLVKKHANKAHVKAVREDAYAEALLALSQAVYSYEAKSNVPVEGFIESRVKYAVWNFYKREKRRWQQEVCIGEDQEEAEPNVFKNLADTLDVAQMVENRLLAEEIAYAVKALPTKQQHIITQTVLKELSLTEIAQELGVSVQAVHNLRKRALARLKTLLSRMYTSERG